MPDAKRLVIDASIAQAAGGRPHETSKQCSDFLLIIRDETEHFLVMTREIFAEWQKHEAKYATTWRKSMVAKKRVAFFKEEALADLTLRDQIENMDTSDANRREMLKDVHLLEAALISDRTVASLNSKDRDRFVSVCAIVSEISNIVWVNPVISEEKCLDYLSFGKVGYLSRRG